jgi:hypothetical protein
VNFVSVRLSAAIAYAGVIQLIARCRMVSKRSGRRLSTVGELTNMGPTSLGWYPIGMSPDREKRTPSFPALPSNTLGGWSQSSFMRQQLVGQAPEYALPHAARVVAPRTLRLALRRL